MSNLQADVAAALVGGAGAFRFNTGEDLGDTGRLELVGVVEDTSLT